MRIHVETMHCVLEKIMLQNVSAHLDIKEMHTSAAIKMSDVKQTVSVPII
jgi:hypothetical protein